jgi:hypothetical protein
MAWVNGVHVVLSYRVNTAAQTASSMPALQAYWYWDAPVPQNKDINRPQVLATYAAWCDWQTRIASETEALDPCGGCQKQEVTRSNALVMFNWIVGGCSLKTFPANAKQLAKEGREVQFGVTIHEIV